VGYKVERGGEEGERVTEMGTNEWVVKDGKG